MRRRRHQWGRSVLLSAFLLSAVVHLLLGVPVRDFVNDYLSSGRHPSGPVKMVRLSNAQWEKNRGAFANRQVFPTVETAEDKARAELEKKKLEEEKKKRDEKLRGQIVEVAPTQDDSANPDAKYLSKYNTHVEKQTTARPEDRDHSLKRVTNKLQTTEVNGNPQKAVQTPNLTVRGDGADDVPGQPGQGDGSGKKSFALEVPDMERKDGVKLKLSDLPGVSQRVANKDGADAMEGNSDRLNLEMGEGGDQNGGDAGRKRGTEDGQTEKKIPNLAALVPTIGTVARISGSPSRDHVDGVPEGDGTFLNTKEFKYATFFYRVRDSVASYWEDLAAAEYRRRDPTGNIYGIRDRSTLLHIQLTRDGRLDTVRVEQTSGVDFLDNVAVQAFKMAEPFPNPPPGIVDEDGQIRFNFQFVVTMRSRGPFNNLFR